MYTNFPPLISPRTCSRPIRCVTQLPCYPTSLLLPPPPPLPPPTRSCTEMAQNRFLHPYYLLNTMLCLAYVALRLQHLHPKELSHQDMFGVSREAQIYVCLAMMLFTRLLSAPTVDVYIASAFMFTRVTIVLCLWYMNFRMAGIFVALWILIYTVCPQPRYRLPSSIIALNNASFNDSITRNLHRTIHIVWCHATWSARCSQLAPILASLSKKFKHPRIRFSTLDVSKFPATAESLGVSISAASKQLPTLICFNQGKEISRIPVVDERGHIPKEWSRGFTALHVAQALDLKMQYSTAKKWEREAKQKHRQKKKN